MGTRSGSLPTTNRPASRDTSRRTDRRSSFRRSNHGPTSSGIGSGASRLFVRRRRGVHQRGSDAACRERRWWRRRHRRARLGALACVHPASSLHTRRSILSDGCPSLRRVLEGARVHARSLSCLPMRESGRPAPRRLWMLVRELELDVHRALPGRVSVRRRGSERMCRGGRRVVASPILDRGVGPSELPLHADAIGRLAARLGRARSDDARVRRAVAERGDRRLVVVVPREPEGRYATGQRAARGHA